MKFPTLNKYIVAFGAGLLAVPGFAPFSLYPLTVLALAILFAQWQHARGKWMAAKLGFAFGFGLFSAGIGWLYVALHDYGGMPMLLAAIAIGLFAALLSGIFLSLWVVGLALRAVEWTQPEGEPFKVSLLQGNIAQGVKFEESNLVGTLETYRRLAQSSDARLIVMPETALPMLRDELPIFYAEMLANHMRRNDGDILIGLFERDRGLYYNSVISLGSAESQSYRKNHLVPFGEFIPLRPVLGWLINEVLHIPMGDQARGGDRQQVMRVAGQKIAVNICYEDAFGEEIIRYLPEATLLVNVTNDAWYGHSHAAMQHNQIAQMRALETGRMLLRATNTGVTSIIGADGRIQQMLPQHQEGVLTGMVQGYSGSTPYVRWGNAAMLFLITLMLFVAWRLNTRHIKESSK